MARRGKHNGLNKTERKILAGTKLVQAEMKRRIKELGSEVQNKDRTFWVKFLEDLDRWAHTNPRTVALARALSDGKKCK